MGAANDAADEREATQSAEALTATSAGANAPSCGDAPLGSHLPGISDDDFEAAKTEFNRDRGPDLGLGPIFNQTACGNCHHASAAGGAGDADDMVTRFGRVASDGTFDTLASQGGSLFHTHTLGNWTDAAGTACQVPAQVIPAEATNTTHRLPPALFGLGLVDALPDAFFQQLAQAEPEDVRGTVNMVATLLPEPFDPSQSPGSMRVGRLTSKCAVAGVTEFAAAAYKNEMGITTQHCVGGQSIAAFATELAPNGVQVSPVECQDNLPGTDFSVGACDANPNQIEFHVAEFAKFITFLAPPPRVASDDHHGEHLFEKTGCSSCHSSQTFYTPDHPLNGVPGRYAFHPYSDYLLHDMGSLGDHVGNQGDSVETTRKMRTSPLWGIRFRTVLLHDGRTTDIATAILAHDGQGAAASAAFNRLKAKDQAALVRYVSTL
jgi:CxxC motif-containing protein (DUF1111 family)